MMEIIKILISGVVSSIITILLSNHLQKKNIKKEVKKDFVRKLFGYRYQLGAYSQKNKCEELNFLLGQVPIIFGNNKKVIDASLKLIMEINDNNLYNLLIEMCKDKEVEINTNEWSKEVFVKFLSLNN